MGIQRLWRAILSIVIGGIALIAVVMSYGGTSQPDALYFYLVGFLTLVSGLGVFISKPDDMIAHLSYLMSIGLMVVCSMDATFSVTEQGWQAKFIPLLQFGFTVFLPCLFLRCFAIFPSEKRFAMNRFFKWWVYAPGVLLFAAMSISYIYGNSYERLFFLIDIRPLPILVLNLVCLLGYSLAGHLCLLHTWLFGGTTRHRMQAKWLFWGLGIGTVPVFFLYTTPSVLGIEFPYGRFSAYTLILIPLCYGVAILKYRLMDIDLVLNRSSVYAVVSSLLLVVYLISVRLFSTIFPSSGISISLFATLIVALLFAPMKRRIQEFIDRYFNQRRYNYRQTLLSLSETLSTMLQLDKLGETLLNQLNEVLQLEFAALLLESEYAIRSSWEHSGYVVYRQIGDEEKLREVLEELDLGSVADEPVRISGRRLVIPLLSKGKSLGFILLGRKLSGADYNLEDISLMRTLSHQTAISVENAQSQREAERIQAGKMKSLRQLVAGVAHEINNPIGTIASNNDISRRAIYRIKEIMERYSPDMEEGGSLMKSFAVLEEMNQVNKNASAVIAKIVANLRSFVGLDEAEWQLVNIHEGIDNAIALTISEFSGHIHVTRHYGDIPRIYCCPSSLNQVFMSIFRNACEAIEGEGTVSFETAVQREYVVVKISDTGKGIPAEDIDRIFDPGFTTKGAKIGVGLGLSICYQIVIDEHEGRISASSELGKGTSFTVMLPRRHSEMEKIQ